MSLTFPSKLVGERVTLTFPFQDELGWGETVISAVVFAEVSSGADLDPELLIYQAPTFIDGINVKQRVRLGVPGVLYQIVCRIVGSLGTTAEKSGYLAILPGVGGTPLLNATYFTSFIYPAVVHEAVSCVPSIVSASVTRMIVGTSVQERVQMVPSVISSTLGAILKTTNVLEKISTVPSIQSSTLDTILKTTNVLEKAIFTPSVVSSTVDTILLTTNVLEKTLMTPSIISSTLTTL